jgi:hypothetical protein
MTEIQLGPTICGAIAWGCGLNMIMFGRLAVKEGWQVPSLSLMSAPRLLGKIGIFVSMMVCAGGAGWWALLIAPGGGMLFGGLSTAILKENTLPVSMFGGIILNVLGAILIAVA